MACSSKLATTVKFRTLATCSLGSLRRWAKLLVSYFITFGSKSEPGLEEVVVAGMEIRVSGRNVTDTEHVRAGAHHSLELEPNRPFEITKASWDVLDLDRLKQACDPGASADLAAVLITEGLAHVFLIGAAVTLQKAKVEMTLPRKRGAAAAGFDTAYKNFLNRVLTAVVRHVNWDVVRCLVVAGPGFVKEDFKKFLEEEAVRKEMRWVQSAAEVAGILQIKNNHSEDAFKKQKNPLLPPLSGYGTLDYTGRSSK